jgi:Tfp pilus assembly protein PilO
VPKRRRKPKKPKRVPAKAKKKQRKKAAEVKAQTKKTTNLMVATMVVVALLAAAFWFMLLNPKKEEAQKLDGRIHTLEFSLSQHRSEAQAAAAARRAFPREYQRLVVLGKAVPSGDETPSLLVQLSHLAAKAEVEFQDLTLGGGSGEGEAPEASGGGFTSPTEAEASLLPLGASIGPAGLAVMPYELTFEGDFFQIAKFIEGLDRLVKTSNQNVAVNGRLITVNSFSLTPVENEGGSSRLLASFSVATFLTPPGEGLTTGAPTAPEAEPTTLTSTTTGTTP